MEYQKVSGTILHKHSFNVYDRTLCKYRQHSSLLKTLVGKMLRAALLNYDRFFSSFMSMICHSLSQLKSLC